MLVEPVPDRARAPRERQLGEVAPLLANAAEIDAARAGAAQRPSRAPRPSARRWRSATAAAQPAMPPPMIVDVDLQALGHAAPPRTGIGLTGGWPRRRPTLSRSVPQARASSSAAASPQTRPWHRPMPMRVNALVRLISRASRVARGLAQRAGRDALAAADDLVVADRVEEMAGIADRRRRAHGGTAPGAASARSSRTTSRRSTGTAEILEQRERRAPALQLGDVGAADACAVAGEVDARNARPALRAALAEPTAARRRSKKKRQPARSASCASGRRPNDAPTASQATRCSAPGVVAPDQRFDATVAFDADRADAVVHAEPAQAIAGRVPEAFREGAGRRQQLRGLRELAAKGVASSTATTSTPAFAYWCATSGSSGPAPTKATRRPIETPCAFSAICAPPSVNTPGSVQPGNGSTRSIAPVARIRRSKRLLAVAVGGQEVEAAPEHVPDRACAVGSRSDRRASPSTRWIACGLLRLEAVDAGGAATHRAGGWR